MKESFQYAKTQMSCHLFSELMLCEMQHAGDGLQKHLSLPSSLCSANLSTEQFKRALKTFLFV